MEISLNIIDYSDVKIKLAELKEDVDLISTEEYERRLVDIKLDMLNVEINNKINVLSAQTDTALLLMNERYVEGTDMETIKDIFTKTKEKKGIFFSNKFVTEFLGI